ncbi:hypothetical protein DFS34DRAFT_613361 [Phlyctochytrium arcticum]|nr:hypothetical protein DFS34DRAFT_613361 [Phlyctochytrium arcticum]
MPRSSAQSTHQGASSPRSSQNTRKSAAYRASPQSPKSTASKSSITYTKSSADPNMSTSYQMGRRLRTPRSPTQVNREGISKGSGCTKDRPKPGRKSTRLANFDDSEDDLSDAHPKHRRSKRLKADANPRASPAPDSPEPQPFRPQLLVPLHRTPKHVAPLSHRQQQVLLSLYLDGSASHIFTLLSDSSAKEVYSLDLPLDNEGNTTLHWAAYLGRIDVVDALLARNVDACLRNNNGETPIMRAVQSSMCHTKYVFPAMLQVFAESLEQVDNQGRTFIHHIALAARYLNLINPANYYVQCVSQAMAEGTFVVDSWFLSLADRQGKTPMRIARRTANESLIEKMLALGCSAKKAFIYSANGIQEIDLVPHRLHNSGHLQPMTPPRNGALGHLTPPRSEERSRAIMPNFAPETFLEKSKDQIRMLANSLQSSLLSKLRDHEDVAMHTEQALVMAMNELSDAKAESARLQHQKTSLAALKPRLEELESILSQTTEQPASQISEAAEGPLETDTESLEARIKSSDLALSRLMQEMEELKQVKVKERDTLKKIVASCADIPVESVDDYVNVLLEELI